MKRAPYPFTTIEPNVGIAHVRIECACRELGVKDEPINSYCVDGWRFAPVELIDVAGLVPDAWRGKGLGNRFLDNLRRAEALIHVVDASGSTDEEGRPVAEGSHDPLFDVDFLEREIDMWMYEILSKDWRRFAMTVEATGVKAENALFERLSGLQVNEASISRALEETGLYAKKLTSWSDDDLMKFVRLMRHYAKPMVLAANKADLPSAHDNIRRLQKELGGRYIVVPTSAEAELALRRAAEKGLIKYLPGDGDFEVLGEMTPKQRAALEYIRENVLRRWGSTGVQQVINITTFDVLKYVAVYPVADENRFTDSKGRVLPEVYLMPAGSTARDLAYSIHTDLGDKFIAAIDARSKRRLGASTPIKHGDVIKIVASK